jgi:hypothetical protein
VPEIRTVPLLQITRKWIRVVLRWYTYRVATVHPRIQVTEDPELASALRAAEPHLPPGLSRSRQVRELAIAGAHQLAEQPYTEERRQELLDRLASHFEHPETAPWDWEVLRDVKRQAWRFG